MLSESCGSGWDAMGAADGRRTLEACEVSSSIMKLDIPMVVFRGQIIYLLTMAITQ